MAVGGDEWVGHVVGAHALVLVVPRTGGAGDRAIGVDAPWAVQVHQGEVGDRAADVGRGVERHLGGDAAPTSTSTTDDLPFQRGNTVDHVGGGVEVVVRQDGREPGDLGGGQAGNLRQRDQPAGQISLGSQCRREAGDLRLRDRCRQGRAQAGHLSHADRPASGDSPHVGGRQHDGAGLAVDAEHRSTATTGADRDDGAVLLDQLAGLVEVDHGRVEQAVRDHPAGRVDDSGVREDACHLSSDGGQVSLVGLEAQCGGKAGDLVLGDGAAGRDRAHVGCCQADVAALAVDGADCGQADPVAQLTGVVGGQQPDAIGPHRDVAPVHGGHGQRQHGCLVRHREGVGGDGLGNLAQQNLAVAVEVSLGRQDGLMVIDHALQHGDGPAG